MGIAKINRFDSPEVKSFIEAHEGLNFEFYDDPAVLQVVIRIKHWSGYENIYRIDDYHYTYEYDSGQIRAVLRSMVKAIQEKLVCFKKPHIPIVYGTIGTPPDWSKEYPNDPYPYHGHVVKPKPKNELTKEEVEKVNDVGVF